QPSPDAATAASGALARRMDTARADSLMLSKAARVVLPESSLFETTKLTLARGDKPAKTPELTPLSNAFSVSPPLTPLRQPVDVALRLDEGPEKHVGIYRAAGGDWEFVSDEYEKKTHRIVATTR